MSGWDFLSSSNPVARKEHRCEWCGELILKGEKHHHYWGKHDGKMQSTRMHLECQQACDDSDLDDELPMDLPLPRGVSYDEWSRGDHCGWCGTWFPPHVIVDDLCPVCLEKAKTEEVAQLEPVVSDVASGAGEEGEETDG